MSEGIPDVRRSVIRERDELRHRLARLEAAAREALKEMDDYTASTAHHVAQWKFGKASSDLRAALAAVPVDEQAGQEG